MHYENTPGGAQMTSIPTTKPALVVARFIMPAFRLAPPRNSWNAPPLASAFGRGSVSRSRQVPGLDGQLRYIVAVSSLPGLE
jgi:hypothetical protein